ncbi:MAG: molybdopterin converting factor subunit 1 [Pontibacterium sp.]
MKITLKCFASLREKLKTDEEQLLLPSSHSQMTIEVLVNHLIDTRGQDWAILAASNTLVAVNHEMVSLAAKIQEGDEVAFFPPVTGG